MSAVPEYAVLGVDPFDMRRVRNRVAPLLREFNAAGVLAAGDVHVASRLSELGGETDEAVTLAGALAVRAPRLGHVYVDLATIHATATVDADAPLDLSSLPWPEASGWPDVVAGSSIVSVGESTAEPSRPLRLVGTGLYLDRYWREERQVAADLRAVSAQGVGEVREDVLGDGLARLFPGETGGRQCSAAAAAVLRRLAVVAGGPGTGKTTTVARIVALLAEQAAAVGTAAPLVALAAPTGKAAARLEEAVHEEALELSVSDEIRAQLLGLRASTLHRLLGSRPGSHSRFRHHRGQRLPHDVVIVDETSMVSLSLMARLVEAIRSDARLILVGDPGQLASIEAGAVLGDIVGPATSVRAARSSMAERDVQARDPAAGAGIAEGIVVLDRIHRFGGGIAGVAEAIRRGDGDEVISLLSSGAAGVTWIPVDVGDAEADVPLDLVHEQAVAAGAAVIEAARAGDAAGALAALGAFRVLCAHRSGPQGVATSTGRIEGWLASALPGFDPDERWYVGRPLLVTENDYELRLYNGDTGVVVRSRSDRVSVAFERGGEIVQFSPSRLRAVDTVYAMTIHKSQGSQFSTAAVLLPAPSSRILTRELLYTAATRARERLVLAGSEEAIRTAVARPIARASGLQPRLWQP